jgi:hypothetical protein
MVNKVFKNQRGQNMEAYVGDMLIKNMNFKKHL